MAGPRKATIVKKLEEIANMLQNTRYSDQVKINKAFDKITKLVGSIGDAINSSVTKQPTEYQVFLKSEMSRLKKLDNNLTFTDLVKIISKNWRTTKYSKNSDVSDSDLSDSDLSDSDLSDSDGSKRSKKKYTKKSKVVDGDDSEPVKKTKAKAKAAPKAKAKAEPKTKAKTKAAPKAKPSTSGSEKRVRKIT